MSRPIPLASLGPIIKITPEKRQSRYLRAGCVRTLWFVHSQKGWRELRVFNDLAKRIHPGFAHPGAGGRSQLAT